MACILQRPGATYSLECLFKSFARKITDPALVLDDLAELLVADLLQAEVALEHSDLLLIGRVALSLFFAASTQ